MKVDNQEVVAQILELLLQCSNNDTNYIKQMVAQRLELFKQGEEIPKKKKY